MKGLNIVVLAKQVPDTHNVGQQAMKEDGTVNRAALPAIFNPEDLQALEQALILKDRYKGSAVTVLTMGPGRATEIIRESMYRGADRGFLITDRKFAGSDTLATSYAISLAVEKLKPFDIILSGRQAIDGDTAQVGPQVAEKLKLPQITYVEEILTVTDKEIKVKRRLENGTEINASPKPVFLTIHGSASNCRPRNVKRLMKYKHATTVTERQNTDEDYIQMYNERPYLNIEEWSASELNADEKYLGLSGSPTKVKKIESVVFKTKETKKLSGNDQEINDLIKELIENHTIG